MPLLLLAVVAMLIQQTMATAAKTTVPVLFPAMAPALGVASEAVLVYTWIFSCRGTPVMAGCGTFIIRYGAIRISQVGGLLMATGLGFAALAGLGSPVGLVMVILGALLISAGSTSATPASSEILARYAPAKLSPLIFSIKQTGVPAGIAIAGALILPLSAWIGWQQALFVVAGTCLLIAVGLASCRATFDRDRRPAQKLAFGDLKETLLSVWGQPALRAMALAAFVFVMLRPRKAASLPG